MPNCILDLTRPLVRMRSSDKVLLAAESDLVQNAIKGWPLGQTYLPKQLAHLGQCNYTPRTPLRFGDFLQAPLRRNSRNLPLGGHRPRAS